MTPINSKTQKHYLLGIQSITIEQDSNYLPFSLDTILLADFFKERKRMNRIIDFGTGAGPVPLFLSTKTTLEITGIDIQERLIELAKLNAKNNQLSDQLSFQVCDIKAIENHFKPQSFDAVIVNPPFFKVSEKSPLNLKDTESIMRHEIKVSLEDIIAKSAYILSNKGTLTMVHRSSRLPEIIGLLNRYGLALKRMRLVHPKKDKEANSVLIEAMNKGQEGCVIEPSLIVHNEDNTYTKEVNQIFQIEDSNE